MSQEKNHDYPGELWRKEYAPGVVALLREITNLNEATAIEFINQLGNSPVDLRRLKVLLTENLEAMASKVYGIKDLSALSFNALRERAAFPHLYREGR